MKKRTQLIVVEGPDQVGKETQSKLLVSALIDKGYKAVRIEVPYNDNLTYKLIYWMLNHGIAKNYPSLFQTIQVLNRMIWQKLFLKRFENKYDFIIFDRWQLSSEVYGQVSGVDPKIIEFLSEFVSKTDLTFVLVGDPHVSEARDDYEKDTDFQKQVRNLYNIRSEELGCVRVSAQDTVENVHQTIWEYLKITKRV